MYSLYTGHFLILFAVHGPWVSQRNNQTSARRKYQTAPSTFNNIRKGPSQGFSATIYVYIHWTKATSLEHNGSWVHTRCLSRTETTSNMLCKTPKTHSSQVNQSPQQNLLGCSAQLGANNTEISDWKGWGALGLSKASLQHASQRKCI